MVRTLSDELFSTFDHYTKHQDLHFQDFLSCKVICILEHDGMHVSLHFKVIMQCVYAYFTLDPVIHQDIRLWLKSS